MPQLVDMSGLAIGRLTVIGRAAQPSGGSTLWLCQCECGALKIARRSSLVSGDTRSCGCLKRDLDASGQNNKQHGMCESRLNRIWKAMRYRCRNSNGSKWHRYGGRGIVVCKEWDESFVAFMEWALANGYAENLEIDRIENDGNYEPGNCRWVTRQRQMNNCSTNTLVEVDGERMSVADACRSLSVPYKRVMNLVEKGRTAQQAVDRVRSLKK